MRKLLTLIIFSLFLLTLVSAAPPQASLPDYGYEVRIPRAEVLKVNQEVKLHIHVYNVSNGVPILPSAATSCTLHLYNATGSHKLEKDLSPDGNGIEWALDITGGNFSELGMMSYLVYCNSSAEGGFVGGDFTVTETGVKDPDGIIIIFLMFFSVVVFFFLLLTLLNTLQDFANLEVDFKTISWAMGAYFANLALYYYLTMFMPMKLMLDISFIGISAFGLTHLFLPLLGLIISWIKKRRVE